MCPGEGACGPAARPGRSPWPYRAEQSLTSHTCQHHPTWPWDGLELQRSLGVATDGPSRPLVTAGQGRLWTAVRGLPLGVPGAGHLPELGAEASPPPQTVPTRPLPSPHVDAGGLCGGAQQQLRGSVPADRSAQLTPGAPGRPKATANLCSPPAGHQSFREPETSGAAGLLTPPSPPSWEALPTRAASGHSCPCWTAPVCIPDSTGSSDRPTVRRLIDGTE